MHGKEKIAYIFDEKLRFPLPHLTWGEVKAPRLTYELKPEGGGWGVQEGAAAWMQLLPQPRATAATCPPCCLCMLHHSSPAAPSLLPCHFSFSLLPCHIPSFFFSMPAGSIPAAAWGTKYGLNWPHISSAEPALLFQPSLIAAVLAACHCYRAKLKAYSMPQAVAVSKTAGVEQRKGVRGWRSKQGERLGQGEMGERRGAKGKSGQAKVAGGARHYGE